MRKSERLLIGAVLILTSLAVGQEASLGDVARKQRSKQKAKPATNASKVLTNEDLPKRPDAAEDDSKPREEAKDEHSFDDYSVASKQPSSGQSAEQWKAQILTQKRAISAQQAQVDQFRASIHFVEANRYVNGVQYNEQQRRRQIQLDQMEKQLEQQKKRLSDLQESARRAGFGNSVYDPND